MKPIPEQLLADIRQASHVVLATHVNPDGDALGSLFGLADILRGLGKTVFPYLEEPVSPLYDFIPGSESAKTDIAEIRQFAAGGDAGNVVCIALDCGDAERLGKEKEQLLAISPFLVIDHHHGNTAFGDTLWLDAASSSTGELVYELAQALDAEVSPAAAYALYVAILTDTGSFHYDNTSPRTLRIAADLVEKGVSPEDVAGKVYDNFSLERLRLMQMVLSTLQLHHNEQVGIVHVSSEMFAESGAASGDVEGFINYPRSIKSVRVAAFLKETKKGFVGVSLRAKGSCDVAAVAATFGGGGHKNAAGFRFTDTSLEAVRETVLTALAEALA